MSVTHNRSDPWIPAAAPFAAVGLACIIGGGLLAAISAHDPTRHGMWTVAYLVLVGGVAQAGLGIGQALLGRDQPSTRTLALQFAGVNVGNAAVIAGTLLEEAWLVDIGGALLALALILFLGGVRGVPSSWPVLLYRALIGFVLVSIPVGLVLARL
jgi:hypothetical protein